MRDVVIDTSGWLSGADFMDGVLRALRAPEWHGPNWNALRDSIIVGDINDVEPPYRFCLIGDSPPPAELRQWICDLVAMVQEARDRGRDIEITVSPSLKIFS